MVPQGEGAPQHEVGAVIKSRSEHVEVEVVGRHRRGGQLLLLYEAPQKKLGWESDPGETKVNDVIGGFSRKRIRGWRRDG